MSERSGLWSIEEQFRRVYAITQTKNFAELAVLLGVEQSAVSDAKRRGKIPAAWLRALLCKYSANPVWILTGSEAPTIVIGEPGRRREKTGIGDASRKKRSGSADGMPQYGYKLPG